MMISFIKEEEVHPNLPEKVTVTVISKFVFGKLSSISAATPRFDYCYTCGIKKSLKQPHKVKLA